MRKGGGESRGREGGAMGGRRGREEVGGRRGREEVGGRVRMGGGSGGKMRNDKRMHFSEHES